MAADGLVLQPQGIISHNAEQHLMMSPWLPSFRDSEYQFFGNGVYLFTMQVFIILQSISYPQQICLHNFRNAFTLMLFSISRSQKQSFQLIKSHSDLFPNSHSRHTIHSWHVIPILTCRWMLNMETDFDHVGSGRGFVWTEGMKYHFYWQKLSTMKVRNHTQRKLTCIHDDWWWAWYI